MPLKREPNVKFTQDDLRNYRQRQVESLAFAIYDAIRATNPSVCIYTPKPEFINGKWEGLDDVGFDGNFNLLKLADALFGRIS